MKLGCINHALLTATHMQSMGVNCIGWIANQVDATMDEYQANLDSLTPMRYETLSYRVLVCHPMSSTVTAKSASACLSAIQAAQVEALN